jgi:hypothetical protein
MLRFDWVGLGRGVAALVIAVLVLGAGGAGAETAAPKPADGRVYEFSQPKPDETVVIGGRGGLRVGVSFWPQPVLASPKDMPAIRAIADSLKQHFVRLVGKHRLEDLMTPEQKRALAAKMVVLANGELAAYDRRAGVASPPGRVYVEDIVFKAFDMEAVK